MEAAKKDSAAAPAASDSKPSSDGKSAPAKTDAKPKTESKTKAPK
jgi:hypothetical protein